MTTSMAATGFQRTLNMLARTPNQSVAALFETSLTAPAQTVRRGVLAAFARRRDEPSQRRFVGLFEQLSEQEVACLPNLSSDFRRTLRKILKEHDTSQSRAACRMMDACRVFDELSSLVEAAADPKHPGGDALAATALQLARALHDEILAYRKQPTGRDPSFARQWALTALTRAVDRFAEHGRVELVDAFLFLATRDNHVLRRLLSDTTHPGHEPLLRALRFSRSNGAIELLAAMFEDPETPLLFLEIAAQRDEPHFRRVFLEALGHPVGPRALASAERVRKITWLDQPTRDWFEMPSEQQATAVRLAVASRLSRRTKLAIVEQFLGRGAPLARQAACELLTSIEIPESLARLEQLLEDNDPQVVVLAARSLRRQGFTGAVSHLARLLDHENSSVRATAKSALRDFNFMRYVAGFDELEDDARRRLGPIIALSDDTTYDSLTRELRAATLARKVRGLQMAAAMGVVDEVLDMVLKLAVHKDALVRCEALLALGTSQQEMAREAITQGLDDPNPSVVKRAVTSAELFAVNARRVVGESR